MKSSSAWVEPGGSWLHLRHLTPLPVTPAPWTDARNRLEMTVRFAIRCEVPVTRTIAWHRFDLGHPTHARRY
ncbi:hypothetical protein RKD18_007975 [Streptomyces phaeoluteigriseus]